MTRLSINRIEAAADALSEVFSHTPQYLCPHLSQELRCNVLLKVETLNPIRCFKGRGIDTVLNRLRSADKTRSIVCASAGNLGQALAFCGRSKGFEVTVTASTAASPFKIERMRALGADVVLVEGEIEAALEAAQSHSIETGAFLIEDSRNLETCEGAGTIGLELSKFPLALDAVLISLGAGAMASGIGCVVKNRCPGAEVICIQPEQAPAMVKSILAGYPVDVGKPNTIADGVAGRYCLPEVLSDLLAVTDDTILVKEETIIKGMRLLCELCGLVVEPAAALGVAAVLENQDRFQGKNIATVICGGNVAPRDFENWVMQ